MEIFVPLIGNSPFIPSRIKFEGVIGQTSVVKKMEFFISAYQNGYYIPTFLFTGSHGLGKTYIAEKIADNLKRRFIVINAKIVEKATDFIEQIVLNQIQGETPVTVLIDEAHSLSKDITTILLTVLNPNSSNTNILKYKNVSFVWDMKKINLIFATTDAHEIFTPLKNRCETVYFEIYSDQEMNDILDFYLKDVKFECDLKDLSRACRSRARDAYLLSQNIERFCAIKRKKTVDQKDWNEIKQIFDIKPMGLNKIELSLLKFISEHGPISCSNIAISMMTNEDTVRMELEVRLRELNFIENTTKGRILSEKGKQYLMCTEKI